MTNNLVEKWRQRILEVSATGQRLELRGFGGKSFYGQERVGEVLELQAHSGIVSYEPTELVVTVRSGTPLDELEAVLAKERQMLAFEPPHFGSATVGGCVAAGLSGPRRICAGPLRDFILGARLLDGCGRHMTFGGQVMKNVAGYDVSRLLAGSLGTLGIITEVSFKVLPIAEEEFTLCRPMDSAGALAAMASWACQPLPISATAWWGNQLLVRVSGSGSSVRSFKQNWGGECLAVDQAELFWSQLRDQQLPYFASKSDLPLWRITVPTAAPELEMGESLIEWNGGLRWLFSDLAAATIRQRVAAVGGQATLYRGGDKSDGVFTPLPPTKLKLHIALKRQFDPSGVLNYQRMYRDF